MKKFLSLMLAACVLAATPALAEDTAPATGAPDEAMMKQVMEFTTPGEMHKMLEGLAGNWTYTSKMWMTPEAPAEESTGTAVNTMVYGGRFLQMDVKGSMKMGGQDMPFEGRAVSGYDKVTQQFQSIWYDGFATGMMMSKGTYNAETKTITEAGEMGCAMEGRLVNVRAETKFIDADNFTYTMFRTDKDGKEHKSMEIAYTRVK